MSDLIKELQSIRLRKAKVTRDFSDPKLAGYLTQKEIANYQDYVLDCNIESWYGAIKEFTFTTVFCPIFLEEAKLFISIYEKYFKDISCQNGWKSLLSENENNILACLEKRLQDKILDFEPNGFIFVKSSSRSAKDSPLSTEKFKKLLEKNLSYLNDQQKINENEQLICLLKAAFQCLKVRNALECIEMFISSERIYQDMLLAVEKKALRFNENFVIRKFQEIDVDMEFRGFVYNGRLTCLSQYNYLIFSQKLVDNKLEIETTIRSFYTEKVAKSLLEANLNHFIIDFAFISSKYSKSFLKIISFDKNKFKFCDKASEIYVIELNPFLCTTDSALFSWEHEKEILEGKADFEFRITEKPRSGSKAMLPLALRSLVNEFSKPTSFQTDR